MRKTLPNIDSSWTLFLDRDGVINQRDFEGYIRSKEQFHFLPGVLNALAGFAQVFDRIIIVTNQQGVGKGLMTERNLEELHGYMLDKIVENGGRIDKVYAALNIRGARNDRRKPRPNMALEARQDFPEIDFKKSVMVGDTDGDIRFGMNLGMYTVLVNSKESVNEQPDYIVNGLEELANEWYDV